MGERMLNGDNCAWTTIRGGRWMKGETIKGRQGKRGGGAEAEAEGGGERDEVTVEGPFSSGSSSLVFLR